MGFIMKKHASIFLLLFTPLFYFTLTAIPKEPPIYLQYKNEITKSFIEKIANAKEIKVRILGSNDEYLDFEFGEDNFAIAKKFVKKINK